MRGGTHVLVKRRGVLLIARHCQFDSPEDPDKELMQWGFSYEFVAFFPTAESHSLRCHPSSDKQTSAWCQAIIMLDKPSCGEQFVPRRGYTE